MALDMVRIHFLYNARASGTQPQRVLNGCACSWHWRFRLQWRKNLAGFLATLRALPSQPRWVPSRKPSCHFEIYGEAQADTLGDIRAALSAVRSNRAVRSIFVGWAFFQVKGARAFFWAGIQRPRI